MSNVHHAMDPELFPMHAELEQRHWWFRGHATIVGSLLHVLVPPDGRGRVLDIGCGTGGQLAGLQVDYQCTGIDPVPAAVALARQRFPNATFMVGTAPVDTACRVPETDAVLLLDVIEHIEDDRAFLAGTLAGMKPGAIAILTVPADRRLWSSHDVAYGHYRRYSLDTFAATWEGLPVERLLIGHFNARLYPLIRVVRALRSARGVTTGASGADLRTPPALVNRLLEAVFSGERHVLARQMAGRGRGYGRGVSLLAVLRAV